MFVGRKRQNVPPRPAGIGRLSRENASNTKATCSDGVVHQRSGRPTDHPRPLHGQRNYTPGREGLGAQGNWNRASYKHGRSCGRNEYQRQRKDKCERCGSTNRLCVHHINDDHFDNRPENLQTLCNSCHMSITKKKWWDAKKAGQPTPKSNGSVGWYRTGQLSQLKPGQVEDALG